MLEPNSRRLLLDSLQPPPNFQLDFAVGTTYTLDLMALLAAPVAFAFSNWQDREGRPLLEPLALLKAIRQNADRMLLFCQAGRIQVPKNYQNLMIDLEDSIVETNAAQSEGAFHPKVWFLKFAGRDGDVLYRMLCLSRNMTFDRSWDTSVCLEGPLTDRASAIARNHPLGQFVEALPSFSTRKLSKSWSKRLDNLAYEIRRVDFEIPTGFDEVLFHPIGIGKKADWPFPDQCDNLLVISPFVTDGTISKLAASAKKSQLVSRIDQLDLLSIDTVQAISNGAWTLDEQAQPEAAELDSNDAELASADQQTRFDVPLYGLHAKVFVADRGWNASLFTGSANATHAAFNSNVEFLTELVGKRSVCGVDAVLGRQNDDRDIRSATSLVDMLVRYQSQTHETNIEEQAIQKFERQVGDLAKSFARAASVTKCDVLDASDSFSLTIQPTKRVNHELNNASLRARPLSFPNAQWFDINVNQPIWMICSPVSLLGVTSFFVFEVSDNGLSRQFVLTCPLENPPIDRRERVLREILNDKEKVLRFLMLLLDGADANKFLTGFGDPGNGESVGDSPMGTLAKSTLLESLLHSLSEAPERIEQVARVISDFSATEEGRKLLPADIDQIWKPIHQVWLEQNAERKSRSGTK